MSNIEYTLALAWGIAIVTVGVLLSTVLWMLLFALIIRYSLDEQHFRVKLFGIFCISSIPYQEIKDVQVFHGGEHIGKQIGVTIFGHTIGLVMNFGVHVY